MEENVTTGRGPVIAFSRDVFFGMRIRTVLAQLGESLQLVKTEPEAVGAVEAHPEAALIVDFNQPVDWPALSPVIKAGMPVLAFGSHTDVEGFRAAKAAGVRRTVSNGEFSRRLPELLAQLWNR